MAGVAAYRRRQRWMAIVCCRQVFSVAVIRGPAADGRFLARLALTGFISSIYRMRCDSSIYVHWPDAGHVLIGGPMAMRVEAGSFNLGRDFPAWFRLPRCRRTSGFEPDLDAFCEQRGRVSLVIWTSPLRTVGPQTGIISQEKRG